MSIMKERVGTMTPHPVDIHVGQRVRLRRTLLGMSQERLASAVDLTFQQIQKYERGKNRIGSSRLYQFATILDVPVSYFFEDMPDEVRMSGKAAEDLPSEDILSKRETIELVRAYYRIPSERARRRLNELVRILARQDAA
jgi:transcriptional regulator with XRE-family HTH domain